MTTWRASRTSLPAATAFSADEAAADGDDLGAAVADRTGEAVGQRTDDVRLAVDHGRPIEPRPPYRDMMSAGTGDLIERVRGGDQHLLGRAAAVGTGSTERGGLEHGDRQACLSRRHRHAHACIAAADHHNVEFSRRHP